MSETQINAVRCLAYRYVALMNWTVTLVNLSIPVEQVEVKSRRFIIMHR